MKLDRTHGQLNGVEKAMMNFSKRQLQSTKPKRKNSKPEKIVEKIVLAFAAEIGMDLYVVESKAVYSQAAGRYLHSQTSESLPDLIGNFGATSVWIELKAPGRRCTLKPHQRSFLMKKIKQGCFACVTDNVNHLKKLWSEWLKTLDKQGKDLLLSDLPKVRAKDKPDEELFS